MYVHKAPFLFLFFFQFKIKTLEQFSQGHVLFSDKLYE